MDGHLTSPTVDQSPTVGAAAPNAVSPASAASRESDDTAAPDGVGRPPGRRGDRALAAALGVVFAAVAAGFHEYLYRPFWYDEIWRAHFVSEPSSTFWSELEQANTPSALGWMALTRASGDVFGWYSWSLRLPGFVALPLLAGATVLLARRFTGRTAAVFAAVWVCAGATFLDLGTQLKPYTVETLAAVCAVLLWTGGPDLVAATGCRARRARIARRTAAGCLALFAVPLVFLVLPLAVVDVWRARGRQRFQAAVEAAPAVGVAGLHTLLFVGHQSSQRLGTYWDAHFLAGRGVLGAMAFVAGEVGRTFTGTPPGIDRYDPSLIHPPTDGAWPSLATGAVVAFAFVVGTVVLSRRSSRPAGWAHGGYVNGGYVNGGYVNGGYVNGGYVNGGYVVGTLAVAQLLVLAASVGRYWPIGPVRTNLFLVPLFAVVTVTGADRICRLLVARWRVGGGGSARAVHGARALVAARATAVVGLAVLVSTALVVQVSSAYGLGLLWERRDRVRGLDQTVDAALTVRRVFRPGDLVVVGGRLMRPGWIYAMEVSDDPPVGASDLPPVPPSPSGGTGEGDRVPRSETVFVTATGDGEMASAVQARAESPTRLLVFVFEPDLGGFENDLTELRRAGWCVAETWPFDMAGTVTVLVGCSSDH